MEVFFDDLFLLFFDEEGLRLRSDQLDCLYRSRSHLRSLGQLPKCMSGKSMTSCGRTSGQLSDARLEEHLQIKRHDFDKPSSACTGRNTRPKLLNLFVPRLLARELLIDWQFPQQ